MNLKLWRKAWKLCLEIHGITVKFRIIKDRAEMKRISKAVKSQGKQTPGKMNP